MYVHVTECPWPKFRTLINDLNHHSLYGDHVYRHMILPYYGPETAPDYVITCDLNLDWFDIVYVQNYFTRTIVLSPHVLPWLDKCGHIDNALFVAVCNKPI